MLYNKLSYIMLILCIRARRGFHTLIRVNLHAAQQSIYQNVDTDGHMNVKGGHQRMDTLNVEGGQRTMRYILNC